MLSNTDDFASMQELVKREERATETSSKPIKIRGKISVDSGRNSFSKLPTFNTGDISGQLDKRKKCL